MALFPDKNAIPSWPTKMGKRWANGMCQGTDRSVWLYRKVPLGPVDDAVDTQSMLAVPDPLLSAIREMERLSRARVTRRAAVRSMFRHVHMLMINVPQRYVPDDEQPLREFLAQQHPRQMVDRRLLLFGVKIKDDLGAHGGLKGRIESLVQTFSEDGVPLADFQDDFEQVERSLKRAGLLVPDQADFLLADAWWNLGRNADTPVLPHDDHMHVFASHGAMSTAWALEEDETPCEDWPKMPGHHKMAMLAFRELEFQTREADQPSARWASAIRQQGAAAISIRGLVEPARVTRAELRRNRNRFRSDIREQQAADKMERAEMIEASQMLAQREAEYSAEGAYPTLIDTSVIAAMNGALDGGRFDPAGLTPDSAAWANMLGIQDRALEETMLCSNVRANPLLKDVPIATVAYSGLPSLSVVGDREGALLGFTERDHQPAYISHKAAYVADTLPILLVAGATGSGKDLRVDTKLPVPVSDRHPEGWTTIGEVEVGDTVFGRDGKPCTVTYVSPLKPTPPMHRITFSDGQSLVADFEHQWVVSSFADRNDRHRVNRKAAIQNRRLALETADRLEARSSEYTPEHDSTLKELLEIVKAVPGTRWNDESGVYAALKFVDVPARTATRTRPVTRHKKVVRKTDPVQLFNVHELVKANLDVWRGASGSNAARWRKQLDSRIAAAEYLLDTVPADQEESAAQVATMLAEAGAVKPDHSNLRVVARKAGAVSRPGRREVVIPMPDSHTATWEATVYPTAVALKGLATRIRQQFHDEPVGHVTEQRMTTGEMIAAGLKTAVGQANFAIRLPGALDLPEADLPIDPYVLGAWLGDGTSSDATIASSTADSCTDELGRSDQSYLMERAVRAGYTPHPVAGSPDLLVRLPGLRSDLRAAGVLKNKHIPAVYQRASLEQRLALLQGLMDTDGTVSQTGRCELALCNERLARGALELIRSLGIKAAMHSGAAAYTLTDPETGEKTRTVTGTRYRINFTTDKPVFSLPRKARRLLAEGSLRDTQQWLYITGIEPVETAPGKCIQVDSPDHTYLAGEGFVPTSNTMVLLNLAWQWSQLDPQIPQVIVDPKVGSDHSDIVEAAGGRVFSLDDLTRADGVFDPLRFAGNAQAGVEVATSMLLQVDPWREDKKVFESELQVALKYGVDNGATCIGQALMMAEEAEMASEALVRPIMALVEASSIFRACVGMDPQGDGLRVSNGISLIKVGNTHLDLPQPGKDPETMNQRQAIALVRMMVFGSAMAMTGRNGVLHFDEAWVAMAGGATEMERLGRLARSQTVLPVLYTQRVSDAVNNGLAGYISRGLILHISDVEEARAACALFNLEPELRVPRITMPAVTGGSTSDVGGTPEWSSLRALKDPITGKVLRGSVAIYKDLAGRAVPVTVTLPPEFLQLASTNPEDIKRKKLARLEFEAKLEQDEAAARAEEMGSEEHRRMSQSTIPDELADVIFDPGEDLSLRRQQVASTEVEESDDFEDAFRA